MGCVLRVTFNVYAVCHFASWLHAFELWVSIGEKVLYCHMRTLALTVEECGHAQLLL